MSAEFPCICTNFVLYNPVFLKLNNVLEICGSLGVRACGMLVWPLTIRSAKNDAGLADPAIPRPARHRYPHTRLSKKCRTIKNHRRDHKDRREGVMGCARKKMAMARSKPANNLRNRHKPS